MRVIQSIAEREEWIVVAIPDIEWRLVRAARPRKRQTATEIIVNRSIEIAEQEVGHTPPFAAWQPRSNKSIGCVDFGRDVHRAPGEENGNNRDPLRS